MSFTGETTGESRERKMDTVLRRVREGRLWKEPEGRMDFLLLPELLQPIRRPGTAKRLCQKQRCQEMELFRQKRRTRP